MGLIDDNMRSMKDNMKNMKDNMKRLNGRVDVISSEMNSSPKNTR